MYTRKIGNEWVYKNLIPIKAIAKLPIALCGSIGTAIASGKAFAEPNDIDFVVNDFSAAMKFIEYLHNTIEKYGFEIHYRIRHNNRTALCPDGCIHHIRFEAPLWLPICIFVVPKMEYWTIYKIYKLQKPQQITKYKGIVDQKRLKLRLDSEPDDLGIGKIKTY